MSNGNLWTGAHTRILIALNELGCSDHVIAGATGHDVETVGRHRRYLGISAVYRSQYSTWQALPPSALDAIAKAA